MILEIYSFIQEILGIDFTQFLLIIIIILQIKKRGKKK